MDRVTEPAAMLRAFEEDWARLDGVLRARGDERVHRGEDIDRDWDARDVYAHVTHWLQRGYEQCRRAIDGQEPLGDVDVDALNRRWRTEDAALSLDDARTQANEWHARWLALLRELPFERWDEHVRWQVGGNGFGHFREHIGYARGFLLDAVEAWWPHYQDALDARAGQPLHGPGDEWTSRDEFAHLARWLEHSRLALDRHLRGETPLEAEHEDVLNARWQAEDRALTLDTARARCEAARHALLGELRATPAERWDGVITLIAQDDPMHHPQTHLLWIVDAPE